MRTIGECLTVLAEVMPETIDVELFSTRLVELCLKAGLHTMPRRPRDRHILLKSVVLTMVKDTT